ncbi:MAG: SusD/RagB family nutrient-binding outer membrane lipoprotein, partial [Chitinophagaceae bacterium]
PAAMQITPATRAAYLANPAVVPTAANLTLSHIIMQKYIALYGYGFMQTWVDMRRYHYTDLDPVTGMQVYADFAAPSGSDLYPDNNGKLAYRARPRYNSEYLYNVAALTSIGAIALDYHTKEQWFSQP